MLAICCVVAGRVLDPSGLGIGDGSVRLFTAAGASVAEVATLPGGEFRVGPVPTGDYRLAVSARGFNSSATAVTAPAEDLAIRLALGPARDQVTVAAPPSIHRERISERPTPTLGHALLDQPGILIQQTSAGQVSPFLRGLTGYHVINLIDGIRFNNSTFRSGPNQYLAFVEPSQAERVEATLGPTSAQFGSDALGGTIHVTTREALPGSHGEWVWFGSSADLSLGSQGQASFGNERWSMLGGVSARRHNDLRAGGGRDSRHALRRFFGLDTASIQRLVDNRMQDTGFDQWGLHGKVAVRPRPGHQLSLWYQQSTQSGSRNYKDLWGGLGRLDSRLAPQQLHFAYLRYERQRIAGLDSLTGTLSANAQRDGSVRQGLRFSDALVTDDSQIKVFGYSGQGAKSAGRHSVVFGGELYDEFISSYRTSPGPSRPLYPDGSRYRSGGFFVQDRWEIHPGLRAGLGGRWTGVRYTTRPDRFGTAASEQDFGDWTFDASLAWQATRRMTLHGQVGRGFRAPNSNDLGAVGLNDLGYEIPASLAPGAQLGSNSGEGATSLGRAVGGLRPEHLLNYETGARWRTPRVGARVQAFWSDLYNPIMRRTLLFSAAHPPISLGGLAVAVIAPTVAQRAQNVVTVATAVDPRAVKAFVNDGRSRYYGGEAAVEWSPNTRWRAEVGVSHIVGRELSPNRNIRRLPPPQGNASLRHMRKRYWWQVSTAWAAPQRRLSGGDIDDERIGASRSRNDIAALFAGGRVSPWIGQGVFTPTGETLAQIQNRVLPGVPDALRVPLYNSTAGWGVVHFQGGVPLGERWSVVGGLFNALDRNYRVHGSGIDAPGADVYVRLRMTW